MDPSADLQVWNNAAYDNNGEIPDDLCGSRQSWGSLKSIFGNPKASFDSVSDKENLSTGPDCCNHVPSRSSSLKSSATPFKPINSDHAIGKKSRIEGFPNAGKNVDFEETRDEKMIDEEIKEIEFTIGKLQSRLEALRLEKAELNAEALENRSLVRQAKLVNLKTGSENADGKKTIDEPPPVAAKLKPTRRGISIGPVEIIAGARRGASAGPVEMFGSARSRQIMCRPETATPVQSRRKSCFLKLHDIDEQRLMSKGFSTVSPKSRKNELKSRVGNERHVVTTISTRKYDSVKKYDLVLNSVHPKKLFGEGEKAGPVASKKPSKPGRIVASRYNNQSSAHTHTASVRKRSLPEIDNDPTKRFDSELAFSVGKSRANMDESKISGAQSSRVKRRWEIPSEIVVHGSEESSSPPPSIVLLPKIKIARAVKESPRDSGPARRVVELIGRKSFFRDYEEEAEHPPVCQSLSYAEEEEEVE